MKELQGARQGACRGAGEGASALDDRCGRDPVVERLESRHEINRADHRDDRVGFRYAVPRSGSCFERNAQSIVKSIASEVVPLDAEGQVWDAIVIGTGAGGATAGFNLARLSGRCCSSSAGSSSPIIPCRARRRVLVDWRPRKGARLCGGLVLYTSSKKMALRFRPGRQSVAVRADRPRSSKRDGALLPARTSPGVVSHQTRLTPCFRKRGGSATRRCRFFTSGGALVSGPGQLRSIYSLGITSKP